MNQLSIINNSVKFMSSFKSNLMTMKNVNLKSNEILFEWMNEWSKWSACAFFR